MITNMPAPVDLPRKNVAVAAQKARTGLIPMRPESDHLLMITPKDGEPIQAVCRARAREDVPRAQAVVICLHERCARQEWPDVDTMREAHPQRSSMDRRGEKHVYGLWSDEPIDPGGVEKAEAEIEKVRRKIEALGPEPEEKAERAYKKLAERLGKAEADLARASAVVGLIAPPDGRDGDVAA